MMQINKKRRLGGLLACGMTMLAALGATGCQVDVNGQTLPSGHYLSDDIQYFPSGPEFKLTKEAAAMKAAAPEAQSGL